jgi:hypothetical protein
MRAWSLFTRVLALVDLAVSCSATAALSRGGGVEIVVVEDTAALPLVPRVTVPEGEGPVAVLGAAPCCARLCWAWSGAKVMPTQPSAKLSSIARSPMYIHSSPGDADLHFLGLIFFLVPTLIICFCFGCLSIPMCTVPGCQNDYLSNFLCPCFYLWS